MKKIIFLLLFPLFASAQSKVELQIQLLTPDLIAQAALDQEPFLEWIKKIKEGIEEKLKEQKGDKDVMVVITVHKDKEASTSVFGKPKLDEAVVTDLQKAVAKHPSPRTRICDYSLAFIAKLNSGGAKSDEYSPAPLFPVEQELQDFKKLSLEEKKEHLMNWAQKELIPLVAHFETTVDPKFAGVLKVGKTMEGGSFMNASVESLTENDPMYWRGTMEMSAGNQLIPFSKVCMYVAKGEFDKARRLFSVVKYFSEKSSLPALLSEHLSPKLELMNDELSTAINQGIAMHDKGKYTEAVAHYEKLLKTFPNSAWLNYEAYFSRSAEMKAEQSDAEWNKSKPVIYACDPLYHMNVRAKTGKEGYLLFRRQEINTLFSEKGKLKADMLKYADIALDLENYGFAGQLYWLILTYYSKEEYDKRNILAHFLYCLDKLGDKESLKNFKGDFPSEFEKISKERQKIMEKSTMYKAFEKKE